jgi:tripartite-type tricarboxylate transporter receptor subunit TctC
LGEQVVVDNRPPGLIPGQVAARALPDGYTLLATGGSFWLAPFLYERVPYDPVKDFSPITVTNRVSYILVVHPGVPVKNIKELIALAKAKPGELNYASGPTGGGSHLSAELFKHMAGVNVVRVAYKGGSAALVDVIGGRVQMTIDDAPTLMPNVKAGKLRVLAISSLQPSPLYPDLPTIAASGVPGYESVAMQGIFAPAKTPTALIKRLNQEIVRVLNGQDAKDKFLGLGVEVVANSPEEFAATLKKEMDRLGKLIKDLGLRVE